MPSVTELLTAWHNGDVSAYDALLPLVYQELHTIASRYLRHERPHHTLQPTALVNEAYLRLVRQDHIEWQGRAHFFALSAKIMRQILVDHARKHHRRIEGRTSAIVPLEENLVYASERSRELLLLDDALRRLAEYDERKSRALEHFYFGGLTAEQSAEVLGVSPNTVLRDREFAHAWLRRELSTRGGADDVE